MSLSARLVVTKFCMVQGVKQISVQSSVSLQHLPYDVALETSLPKEIEGKLSFATQKLHEIVKAKTPASKAGSLTQALPAVGEPSFAATAPFITLLCLLLSPNLLTEMNIATHSLQERWPLVFVASIAICFVRALVWHAKISKPNIRANLIS